MAPPVRESKHPITAYYSVYQPRKDERLSRPGWLVTYWNKVLPLGVEPRHVTHPSTNQGRRRVTSLIRPMPLPQRHAATAISVQWTTVTEHNCNMTELEDRTSMLQHHHHILEPECDLNLWPPTSDQVIWLVGWSLTVLSTQFRSYRTFKVELYYKY